jgi:hypothetical protein
MLRNWSKSRICVLALGLVFLVAQLHFCADLGAADGASHFCPFCATAGAAVATSVPVIGLAPGNAPVEWTATRVLASADVCFSIAPRAPPSV